MKTLITLLAALTGSSAMAQNLTNPDFEAMSSCPTQQTNPSYTLRATGWTKPTAGTSDYFNSCGFNIASHISAYSGAGFVGAYMENRRGAVVNYKEYLTNQLSAPLVAGVTYTFSFYTAHLYGASPAGMAPAIPYVDLPAAEQGYIGAVFSTVAPTNASTEPGSSNYGSIVNTFGSGRVLIPATNTDVYGAASRNAWVPVTLQYTAVGGEEYMTFGQFRPGATSLIDTQAVYYLFDGFSPTLTITPLPVTLAYFNAEKSGDYAQLNWSTTKEQRNKGFEIERSADGEHWSSIGTVPSLAPGGNSTTRLAYTFTDKSPLEGKNFYRLKQIDADGKSSYSPVTMVGFDGIAGIRLYPNPVNNQLTVDGLTAATILKVVNIAGQTLKTLNVPPGTQKQEIDMSLLPVGLYFIHIINKQGIIGAYRVSKD